MTLVSVVMPAYNAEKHISTAIDSVLNQSYQNWELIIVNDGSTDSTLKIIESYQDSRIRTKSIPNSGAAKVPRDVAVSMSQGEWIVALDADDYLLDKSIEKMVERANATGAQIVVQQMLAFNQSGITHKIPKDNFDFSHVISGKQAVMLTIGEWVIGANGAMIKKELWQTKKSYLSEKNHMNIDEYDTRDMMIRASKVAFSCESKYMFAQDDNSITRRVSYKLFEPIITNFMLVELMKKEFGAASEQYRIANNVALSSVLGYEIMLKRMSKTLTKEDYNKAKQVIDSQQYSLTNCTLPLSRKIALKLPKPILRFCLKILL